MMTISMPIESVSHQPKACEDAADLAAFTATGSSEAFARIVQRHAGMIHAACRRMLGDRHPSLDDACQGVILILARRASGIRPPGLVAWLFGCAHMVCRNIKR